jgi:formamidopyrimidine-DNA glycosylase
MPELPEITILAQQMNKEIVSKRIDAIEARQPKNLNIPVKDFEKGVLGRTISQVTNRGKWIFINLDQSYFMLVNLGMGAEILYFQVNQKLPEISFQDHFFRLYRFYHLILVVRICASCSRK